MWRFEQRTFYIGSLRAKLILACLDILCIYREDFLHWNLLHCLQSWTENFANMESVLCKTTKCPIELKVNSNIYNSFHLWWCMPGGSVWDRMKSKLFHEFHWGPHLIWSPSMNRYRMFLVQSSLPSSMHQKLTKHGKCCMQNNQPQPKLMSR